MSAADTMIVIGGVITVISAVTAATVTIINAAHGKNAVQATESVKVAVESVATATKRQTEKIERIEVLVDGRYGKVLDKLASVLEIYAANTGTKSDKLIADTARQESDEQQARVILSGEEKK